MHSCNARPEEKPSSVHANVNIEMQKRAMRNPGNLNFKEQFALSCEAYFRATDACQGGATVFPHIPVCEKKNFCNSRDEASNEVCARAIHLIELFRRVVKLGDAKFSLSDTPDKHTRSPDSTVSRSGQANIMKSSLLVHAIDSHVQDGIARNGLEIWLCRNL